MEYLDPSSHASDPGNMQVAERKLLALHPELASEAAWAQEMARHGDDYLLKERQEWRDLVAEHLVRGDSRAAVVVAMRPPVVAAYSEDLDAVALLTFPDRVVAPLGWRVGTRLVTVNTYRAIDEGAAPDIVLGEGNGGDYGNVHPFIADLLTDDGDVLESRKAEIDEGEWERCTELGREALERGTRPRDGRPIWSGSPAGMPGYWWGMAPGQRRPQVRWGRRIVALLVLYALFAGASMSMEWLSRQRFSIPSNADVRATAKGPARIQMERARHVAMERRDAWLPYQAYSMVMNVLMLGAMVGGLWGFPFLWRSGLRHPATVAIGGMLIWIAPIALVMAPQSYVESRLERMRSSPEAMAALLAETETRPRRAQAPDASR